MSWIRSERWDAPAPIGAVVAAVLVTVVLVADIATGTAVVLLGLMIVGPLLCALTASPRVTRLVGAYAVAGTAASFLWGQPVTSWRYWIPLAVVTAASVFAALMSGYRSRTLVETERMRMLTDLADIATPGRGLRELAQDVVELLVPRLADFCVIDQYAADGSSSRLAGAFSGDPVPLREFMARRPAGPAACAEGDVPATRHLPAIDEDVRRRIAHDEEHLRILRQLGIASSIAVPLFAQDRPVGSLLLATCTPREPFATRSQVEFVETLAGRVALALGNAALGQELADTQRERDTILDNIDAAITVRAVDGRMVYANDAAARLLKLPRPEDVMTFPPGELIARFDVYTEEGDDVDLADLPGTRILAGELDPPPLTVRNVDKATGEERWLLNKATAVFDEGGNVSMAVNVIEDVTQTKRSEVAQRLLASTARELAEMRDPLAAMQVIADAAVPGLADWAGVDLVEPSGEIRTVAIAHRDPEKVRLGWRLRTQWPPDRGTGEGFSAVIETGEAQLVRDIPDELLTAAAQDREHLHVLRSVGLTSTMIAPIRVGNRVLGALSFVSSTSRRFDDRDLELACDLGRQTGVFINNAQLHAEQAHIARTLQAGLVPATLPVLPGWDLSSAYRAAGLANEVGGDFYDVVEFDGGWAAIIGDVVGKGARAASLTAVARHTLAAIIKATGDGAQALEVLNRRLRERLDESPTLTTVAILLVQDAGRVTVFSAGHPLPLLRRGTSAQAIGTTCPLLGYVDELEIVGTELESEPGDQFVLYTDGVLDAAGAHDRFGEERLLAAARSLPADQPNRSAELIAGVIEDFLAGEQSDDIAIVTMSRSGSGSDLQRIADAREDTLQSA